MHRTISNPIFDQSTSSTNLLQNQIKLATLTTEHADKGVDGVRKERESEEFELIVEKSTLGSQKETSMFVQEGTRRDSCQNICGQSAGSRTQLSRMRRRR